MSSGLKVNQSRTIPELQDAGRNDTSQFGEDGLIQRSLEIVGESNRWCFEIGAADGLRYSNTKRLRDVGWDAVLIERDDRNYESLSKLASEHVRTFHVDVKPDGLSPLLKSVPGFPLDPDLGVIDVDGPDYWFLTHMEHRPRVLLVEVWTTDSPIPAQGQEGQAGRTAIVELGEQLGYRAVAETFCNVLFWHKDAA